MFMQIWDHQILTLKIPLKCFGLSNVWDYVASMHVWVNQILTLKIPLKLVGFIWQVWLNQILTPQNTINMDFSIKWSQHFDFLHFNSAINLNKNFKLK